jgi:thiamine-monophosphate kinase
MQIKDIGEQGLLRIIQKFCPSDIIGDDGAILTTPNDRALVITTDMLVEEVHFSDRTTSAQDTGWRAVAANLSDLAAMGATPLGITVALSVTPETPVNWVEELYQGMTACLKPYNTPIIGGDIVRSRLRAISITALGYSHPDNTIRRNTAKPGEVIVATGIHGASRAGLELLLNPELGETLTPIEKQTLIRAHQRPYPRLDVLPHLWDICQSQPLNQEGQGGLKPPLLRGARGDLTGMDSSDGLADAIIQICHASGIGARIERDKIPIPSSVLKLVTPEKALDWALYGGEDFELVLCLPPEIGEKLVAKIGKQAAIMGITTDNPSILLVDQKSLYPDEALTQNKGFQHFT